MTVKKEPLHIQKFSHDIALRIELQRSLTTFNSEESFLGRNEGNLFDIDTLVGKARLFVVDLEGASNQGFEASWMLDVDGATAPYMQLLGDEAGNFSAAVLKILGEEFAHSINMLIIDRLELLPHYRGRGLGLQCSDACIRHLSPGCRIAALKPYPLQFEATNRDANDWQEALAFGTLSRNKRLSTQRLKQHYGRLNFQHVPRTDLMIRDLES